MSRRVDQNGSPVTTAPLSWMQEQIYLLERLESHNPAYHSMLGLRLTGRLDPAALARALGEVMRRHSVLRSRIRWRDIRPQLETMPFEPPRLERVEPTVADAGLAWAVSWARERARRPMDLERGPLFQPALLRLADDDHVLVVLVHHLATDGWSQLILIREILAAYAAFAAGGRPDLPELPIQFSDYAREQRERLSGAGLERELVAWRQLMEGMPAEIELPIGGVDRSAYGVSGAVEWTWGGELGRGLNELARATSTTSFAVVATALGILLSRYDGRDRVAFSAPFAGRTRADHYDLVGCFINTLPLPFDGSGDPSVVESIQCTASSVWEAFAHQEVPLSSIVSSLAVERRQGHRPFHQVLFNFRSFSKPVPEGPYGGVRARRVRLATGAPATDLVLDMEPEGDGWLCRLDYRAGLFERETIERARDHLTTLLSAMIESPGARIGELPILTDRERARVVGEWNETRTEYPRDASVPAAFVEVARRVPEAIAVGAGGRTLRYRDLDRLSDSLAERLTRAGAGPGSRVGIRLPRSLETVVAMLGVLKAGGAYVPLDPTHPESRLAGILEDAEAGVVLVERGTQPMAGRVESIPLDLDALDEAGTSGSAPPRPTDPAYVMYTSGSTGTPKGVVVPHRAILRLVRETDYVRLGPGDVIAHVSNPAFDAATFEIWGALLNGARLVVLDPETVLSPTHFARVLREEGVTTLFLTTALFNLMAHEAPGCFATLREVLFGGEAVDPASVRHVLAEGPPARLLHVYGPTEATTFATWHEVGEVPADAATVPIGMPIANTTAYVLDPQGRPVPANVAGELYLGGDGIASGYVGRPDETRERFVPDPFADEPEARLYRTGDRVRRRSDGAIEFLGRLDRQLKIRGFRIEPGEIEAVLLRHPAVSACVVDRWAGDPVGGRLAAWIVPAGEPPEDESLKDFLRSELPAYMIPSAFVALESLPMTPNGKIDRGALPPPRIAAAPDSAAVGEIETVLLRIWEEVLEARGIGLHDDFFDDLGGHSLLAAHLFSRVERELDVELPLEVLFRSPTVAALADEIRRRRADETALFALQPVGEAPPLFCIHGAGGHLLMYRRFAALFAPDRPVYGFALNRLHVSGAFPSSVEAMAERYLDEMLRLRPSGPYHLSGYSFGGLVAWEMARRLEAAGRRVGLLAMFDATREAPARHSRGERAMRFLREIPRSVAGNVRRLRTQSPAEWSSIASQKAESLRSRWRARRRRGVDPNRFGDLFALCRLAHRRYDPGPYGGGLTYFFAEKGFEDADLDMWRALAGEGVRAIGIEGRHTDVFRSSILLARHVRACLEEIERGLVPPPAAEPEVAPAARIEERDGAAARGPRQPPAGPIETAMVELWEQLLRVAPIGREDRFTDLGGHSILAAQLLVGIERRWDVRLPEAIVFSSPTPAELAERIAREIAARGERPAGPATA